MKLALLAASALVASSFSPIAPPGLTAAAGAVPSPSVLLCTDSKSLGPPQNGSVWGTPFLLPANTTVITTFEGPIGSGDTEHFVATRTIRTGAIIQRCPVLNGTGNLTGRHQDVVVAPAGTETEVFNCQVELTTAGIALGYRTCSGLAGGSGDDR